MLIKEYMNNSECCVPFVEIGRCACGENEPISEPSDQELEEIEASLDDILPFEIN